MNIEFLNISLPQTLTILLTIIGIVTTILIYISKLREKDEEEYNEIQKIFYDIKQYLEVICYYPSEKHLKLLSNKYDELHEIIYIKGKDKKFLNILRHYIDEREKQIKKELKVKELDNELFTEQLKNGTETEKYKFLYKKYQDEYEKWNRFGLIDERKKIMELLEKEF